MVSAPPSVVVNAFQSSTEIRAFPERVNLSLPAAISVNITPPGTYTSHPTTLQTIAAGTSVDSYLFHFDPVSGTSTRSGSVTFDRKILGVIVADAQLSASDGTLGAVGTTYPTGVAGRKLDLDVDAADSVSITATGARSRSRRSPACSTRFA